MTLIKIAQTPDEVRLEEMLIDESSITSNGKRHMK